MTTAVDISKNSDRNVWRSIGRGLLERCPRCGIGKMFHAYLKVNDACPHCAEELFHHRADDAPPYLTMLIVGHVVLGGLLAFEVVGDDVPVWLLMIIWPLVALVLSLLLLPRLKGALIAYQWALRMHGFDPADRAGKADKQW